MPYKVIQGDCISVLKDLDDESFDSVVTDPPYALSFMGKDWDSFGANGYQDWCERWATECLRILKPGAFLLAFGGTRTYHRLTTAIEDAGFEIRDSLHWIYGSGFPKSRDVSKGIDSEAGAKRTVISQRDVGPDIRGNNFENATGRMIADITAPATEAAKAWAGWGTALKPAHEPIVMARKLLAKGHTVAANVLEFGTGGINIDGCRVGEGTGEPKPKYTPNYENKVFGTGMGGGAWENTSGRWPPNVVLAHSPGCEPTGETRKVKTAYRPENEYAGSPDKDVYGNGLNQRMSPAHGDLDGTETLQVWNCAEDCPVQEIDSQSGTLKSGQRKPGVRKGMGFHGAAGDGGPEITGNEGGASRFFPRLANSDPLDSSACFRYQAKASKKERPVVDGIPGHPTVKPVALMQWLVRLVTPPGGHVLDPFAGTGTTAEACWLEGFSCLLIERDSDSIRRIEKRMSKYETEAA